MNNHEKHMLRCIELAKLAADNGELPFTSVLTINGKVITEAGNRTIAENDVTAHAEILVLREGQRQLGKDLSACTIYSNCEPCAMCAFMIRELRVGCIVFAVNSPLMGGYSRWDILQDNSPEVLAKFQGKKPEIISGFMADKASMVFAHYKKPLLGLPHLSED